MWFKFDTSISDADCICKACKTSVSKKLINPKYTPQKTRKKQRSMCELNNYDKCSSLSSHSMQCNTQDVASCFTVECNMDSPHTFSLCKYPYNLLWKQRFENKCAACHVTIQQSSKKYLCNSLGVGQPAASEILLRILGERNLALAGYPCFTCYTLVSGEVSSTLSVEELRKSINECSSTDVHVTKEDQIIEQCLLKVYDHIINASFDSVAVLLIDIVVTYYYLY